jgi:hypothetical protein
MQLEVAEQDSGPDPGDESFETSFPEDDELSDGSFGDCILTISLADGVEMRDDDDDESSHKGSKSGEEMQLGIEAPGLGLQEDSPDGLLCGEDYTCPGDNTRLIPKGRFIAHLAIEDEKAVYMSFDIEIASEAAGIIQISAEIFWLKIWGGE